MVVSWHADQRMGQLEAIKITTQMSETFAKVQILHSFASQLLANLRSTGINFTPALPGNLVYCSGLRLIYTN